jgi:hypothetical protein
VTVTDQQMATLRAFLDFDPEYQRLTRQLAAEGPLHGYGDLVCAAFVSAVWRRFGSAWTSACADVFLVVLSELASSEHLDAAGLDEFMAEARVTADARLAGEV